MLPGLRSSDPAAIDRLGASYSLSDIPEHRGPAFSRPSLIVTGRQDHVVGSQDQARLLTHYPRATYAVLDAAGHNAHLDQPEIVSGLIRDWSRRMLVAAPEE